jgi:hypothetical protein
MSAVFRDSNKPLGARNILFVYTFLSLMLHWTVYLQADHVFLSILSSFLVKLNIKMAKFKTFSLALNDFSNLVASVSSFLPFSNCCRHHPVDWNNPTHPLARKQPRRGARAILRATLAAPPGPLVVYNAHLEVFCGMLARISQLSDIFADSKQMIEKKFYHQAILGDLNTMAQGIARFSKNYCCDRMRFLSLGNDEAVMWERNVLKIKDPRYLPSNDADILAATSRGEVKEPSLPSTPVNSQLLRWGLDLQSAQDATNPGFTCPFEASKTVTLDNLAYRLWGFSLMKGKLDWTLLRRLRWLRKELGNLNYELSDHRWMLVEVQFE